VMDRDKKRARDSRYYASSKGQENRSRKVVRPGKCGASGCDSDRHRYHTGSYDGYCWRHRCRVRSRSAVKKARHIRDLAWAEAKEQHAA
jgi:hypothetical protein